MDINDKSTCEFLEYTEHYSTLVSVCRLQSSVQVFSITQYVSLLMVVYSTSYDAEGI